MADQPDDEGLGALKSEPLLHPPATEPERVAQLRQRLRGNPAGGMGRPVVEPEIPLGNPKGSIGRDRFSDERRPRVRLAIALALVAILAFVVGWRLL